MSASACGGIEVSRASAGGRDPAGRSLQVVWNIACCAVVMEPVGRAAGLENGFVGAASSGGSAKGGFFAVRSKKSNMSLAFASR